MKNVHRLRLCSHCGEFKLLSCFRRYGHTTARRRFCSDCEREGKRVVNCIECGTPLSELEVNAQMAVGDVNCKCWRTWVTTGREKKYEEIAKQA
jgi:hypothetical protein